jgi:hypothetical protein
MRSNQQTETAHAWIVVGFTLDQVVWWRTHEAFAKRCAALWVSHDRPTDFQLLEKRGYDANMLSWFVSPVAVRLLDAEGEDWREYVCGTTSAPPPDSSVVPLH